MRGFLVRAKASFFAFCNDLARGSGGPPIFGPSFLCTLSGCSQVISSATAQLPFLLSGLKHIGQ
ncbi:MAG: hypothetical protein UW54_C0006G0003 [Parcubacteria group bacterium GW2011_GWC1_44_26]|nr:MAG: hypothetical protein UW54_C0006G0003 [Parcubacteria group bacterium GW2011_GWC1_44_26]